MNKMAAPALAVCALLAGGCVSLGDGELTTRERDLLTYGALTLADAGLAYAALDSGATEANQLHTAWGDDAATVALSIAITGAALAYLMDRLCRTFEGEHDHRAWRRVNTLRLAVDLWGVKELAAE